MPGVAMPRRPARRSVFWSRSKLHASADAPDRQAGYPEYELRAGGADLAVGAGNVAEYVEAVTHATLREGIQAQLTAFRRAV